MANFATSFRQKTTSTKEFNRAHYIFKEKSKAECVEDPNLPKDDDYVFMFSYQEGAVEPAQISLVKVTGGGFKTIPKHLEQPGHHYGTGGSYTMYYRELARIEGNRVTQESRGVNEKIVGLASSKYHDAHFNVIAPVTKETLEIYLRKIQRLDTSVDVDAINKEVLQRLDSD